jgi:hypothetical protein
VLVKADLTDGDAVVTQGIQQLSDGASVRLLDAVADQSGGQGNPAGGEQGSGKRPGSGTGQGNQLGADGSGKRPGGQGQTQAGG